MMTLEEAIITAAALHTDQTDKQGLPYILHPLRVMIAVPDYLRVLAVLHDVLEDCNITAAALAVLVDDHWTMERLDHLCHRHGENRVQYIERVCTTPETVIVKCADLCDNASRIEGLRDADARRLYDKYARDCAQIADWYETSDSTVPGLAEAVAEAETVLSKYVGR